MGLAIEKKQPDSRNTTVTNKILQYVQAGNFVLATNTAGQQEIAAEFNGEVQLVEENDPQAWSRMIEYLLQKPIVEDGNMYKIFSSTYSWEAQEQVLLSAVEQAVSN
ncbi:MAG: glycosyltransferase family 4 protein [Chitinophagaceae bacterium]|nr:glycosyltransferase family 4 protein [Chitinophagaceae bacterium]